MRHFITRKELVQVQVALLVAIGLQLLARQIGDHLLPGSQILIILAELILVFLIGFTVNHHKARDLGIHHFLAVLMLSLLSAANLSGLVYVLHLLITNHAVLNGEQLLTSAITIFLTNIIVFGLWYWEIDSPGLTRTRWSKNEQDFQFTQQQPGNKFPGWRPQFGDYLFMSVANATSFAPAETMPLSLQAKALMGVQSLISVFTLALLIARAVTIIGT